MVRVLGLALLVAGGGLILVSASILLTGRRPIWLQRRQSLTDAGVRLWGGFVGLNGVSALAIGGPYALSYPVTGDGTLLQACGFAVLVATAVGWLFVAGRSGYRTL